MERDLGSCYHSWINHSISCFLLLEDQINSYNIKRANALPVIFRNPFHRTKEGRSKIYYLHWITVNFLPIILFMHIYISIYCTRVRIDYPQQKLSRLAKLCACGNLSRPCCCGSKCRDIVTKIVQDVVFKTKSIWFLEILELNLVAVRVIQWLEPSLR